MLSQQAKYFVLYVSIVVKLVLMKCQKGLSCYTHRHLVVCAMSYIVKVYEISTSTKEKKRLFSDDENINMKMAA